MPNKLSCCLIIKNEQNFIVSCLNKLFYIADEIVLVDTGSTDNTHKIIESWIKQYKLEKHVKFIKVGGMFNDEDGDFHFGNARTYSFQQATGDYVMWLDAADIIEKPKEIKTIFKKVTSQQPNVYFYLDTAVSETVSFPRIRITPKNGARMIGRVHEYMYRDPKWKRCKVDAKIINRANGEERSLSRNMRLLLKDWKENPSSRNAFYLGNTYYGQGDTENALYWFTVRAYQFPDIDKTVNEERYKSLELAAELTLKQARLKKIPVEHLLNIANEMIKYIPNRYEGYYFRGKYYMEMKNWPKAIANLEMSHRCDIPSKAKMWLNPLIYKNNGFLADIELCKRNLQPMEKIIDVLDFNDPSTLVNPNTSGGSITGGTKSWTDGNTLHL